MRVSMPPLNQRVHAASARVAVPAAMLRLLPRGQVSSTSRVAPCKASSTEADPDFVAAVNEACNSALLPMLNGDEAEARRVVSYLQLQQTYLTEEGEISAAEFLGVLRALLSHSVPRRAAGLQGLYSQAFDRLLNQVQGSEWRLAEESKPAGEAEPKFSTWEEALGGGKSKSSSGQSAGNGAADTVFYDLLGVPPTASSAEIKSAYRQLALQLHPDVNDADDATERFAAVAAAYDALSSHESRGLYDSYGAAGMRERAGHAAGHGNASKMWDEFKPHKRANKRTRARDASRASYASVSTTTDDDDEEEDEGNSNSSSSGRDRESGDRQAAGAHSASEEGAAAGGGGGGKGSAGRGVPEPGAVVEYPLSEVVMSDLRDGRTHGVGLLVGRNMDRGDAARLPPEALDLCEVEPLRQEGPGSNNWIPDELSPSTFPRLGQLKAVAVAGYDPRFDVWRIEGELSEGCGGPELPEEVML